VGRPLAPDGVRRLRPPPPLAQLLQLRLEHSRDRWEWRGDSWGLGALAWLLE
jgi:hypothetical protein